VTTVLDLDPATLGLVDGALWTGDGTWTVNAPPPYGPVTGRHYNDLPVLRIAFGDGAPAVMVPALEDVGTQWTVHLVARAVVTADGEGVSLAGTPLRMTAAGGWMLGYGSTVTDPVSGVRVLTVACDGTTATLYLDGVVVGTESAWTLGEGSVAVLAVGGPGHVWELARMQLLDEVPATLADDIAALVAAYVSDVVELEATGTWGITGTVTVRVGDLYQPPALPDPVAGGGQNPPALPDPVPPPDTLDASVVRRYSELMDTPDLNGAGWPVDWEPTEVVDEPWATLQVVVDGVDVTQWGGVRIPMPSWSRTEPFGASEATLLFPQITVFHGEPDWCVPGAWVDVRWRLVDGTVQRAWRGVVDKFGRTEDDGVFSVACRGPVLVADLQLRTPAFDPAPRDVGTVIAEVLNTAVSRRTLTCEPVVTGCLTSVAGGWEPRTTGFIQQLLATAVKDGRQWTVECEDRTPVIRLKDTETVSWSVRAGQRGVGVDLAQDWSQATNVLFGEGVAPDGGRWRNAVYPGWHPDETPAYPGSGPGFTVGTTDASTSTGRGVSDWQRQAGQPVTGTYDQSDRARCFEIQKAAGIQEDGFVGPQTWAATFGTGTNVGTLEAFFMPLAWSPKVMPRRYEADGTDVGDNEAYDAAVIRVEDKIDFGQGVTKVEGKRAAREQLARLIHPGWSGTVTLELDPAECSRFEIREGSNGLIYGFRGAPVQVHVAAVDQADSVVTLTIDTNARDYPTLDAIRDRERNATDPAKAVIKRLQKGTITEARATFDSESPAGQLPRHALFTNLWSVVPVPFGRYGRIVRTAITTSDAASPFAVAVFNEPVTAEQLVALVGNPLTAADNPWDEHADDLAEAGLVMAWGWKSQPCGYYPKHYSTPTGPGSAPVTGRMVDDASFEYATERSPWMWVATIASSSCWVEGRFWPGAD
jgi:hypothetical protein